MSVGNEESVRPLSPSLLRTLRICKDGKEASLQQSGMTFACLCGMLVERGLVRSVKHRDHTRTYTPTAAGLEALRRAEQGPGHLCIAVTGIDKDPYAKESRR